MNELNIYGTGNGNTETEYPKGDTNGSLSDASTIPRGDNTPAGGLDGAGGSYQNKNPQLNRILAVVRGYCAIGREKKKGGKWTPGVRAHARSANGYLQRGRKIY